MPHLAFIHMPSGMEWLIVLAIGLLIFGRNLPQVGRSLGRGIVEFKKGLKGMKDEMDEVEKDVHDAELEPDRTAKLDADREKVSHKPPTSVAERSDHSEHT